MDPINPKPFKSNGIAAQFDNVFYDLPCNEIILDYEGKIFVPSLFVTWEHFPEKRIWQCNCWGEFYYFLSDYKQNWLILISDDGCGVDVLKKLKEISKRYVEMQNDSQSVEDSKFKNLKMWSRVKDNEDFKYKKALTYLLKY